MEKFTLSVKIIGGALSDQIKLNIYNSLRDLRDNYFEPNSAYKSVRYKAHKNRVYMHNPEKAMGEYNFSLQCVNEAIENESLPKKIIGKGLVKLFFKPFEL